jgi:hypothetical protein
MKLGMIYTELKNEKRKYFMIEDLSIAQHRELLFIATFLMGLLLGAVVSSTIYALQEARKKKYEER